MKLFILISLFFTSCAQMQQQWRESTCNTDAAYSKGVQDARNSAKHDNSELAGCGSEAGSLQRSYSEGFNSVVSDPMHILKSTIEKL